LSARAAAAGIQVVAETHSDHFLDGVRIEVRESRLEPSSVAIHYFERRGAEAQVVSPEIDKDGRLSQWPEGFFDQHEENLSRLIAPAG
jgi:predicted ATPase